MLTSRRLSRSGPDVADAGRTASRSWTGRTGEGARSSTIVRTGGTAAGAGEASPGGVTRGSRSVGCSGSSVAKLQGSRTISSGLIDHNLHRLDFGHQNTEISGFYKGFVKSS